MFVSSGRLWSEEDDVINPSGRPGSQPEVLIYGVSSRYNYQLAMHVLRQGGKVTVLQPEDASLDLSPDARRNTTTQLSDVLESGAYDSRLTVVNTTNCDLSSMSKFVDSVRKARFSYVLFVGADLCRPGVSRGACVRLSVGCLVGLLEATKATAASRPHFTLLTHVDGGRHDGFVAVMETSLEIILHVYRSIYDITANHRTLPSEFDMTDSRQYTHRRH